LHWCTAPSDAAAWPFPPTPDLAPTCPCCSAPSHFAPPSPRGCFPSCTLVPHSCTPITHMRARKHICFCRDFHSFLPSYSWFPHSQPAEGAGREEGYREPEDVHPPELLPPRGGGGQGTRGQARRASSQRQS